MADQDRSETAPVAPPAAPQARSEPLALSFYQALRRIECAHSERPRIGQGATPKEEPLRLGQAPTLNFQSSQLSAMQWHDEANVLRVRVNFFGAFGPNGPLPLHLTEYAHQRGQNNRDFTLAAFVDIFHHRLLSLFYRAWANSQPTVSLDRLDDDRFARWVSSLAGLGSASDGRADADPLERFALHCAGHFVSRARHPEGLIKILQTYFSVPADVEEFVGDWLRIPDEYCWRLGAPPVNGVQLGVLGQSARLGSEVWERQAKFRIVIGPLSRIEYERFLPGNEGLAQLRTLVERYVGKDLHWDLRLLLAIPEQQPTVLGISGTLGRTSYIGERDKAGDKTWQDLIFAPLNTDS